MDLRLPVVLLLSATLAGCPREAPDDTDVGDDTGVDTDTGADTDTGVDTDTNVDTDPDSDDTDTGSGRASIRIATWNVGGIANDRDCVDDDTTAWDEYAAAIEVLTRIDADVVCINEVCDATDAAAFLSLAEDLGYSTVWSPPNSINPNSAQRNGVMTRLPVVTAPAGPTSAALSGDPNANDLTRLPVTLTVDLPDREESLTVVCQHWKSGFGDDDEFRRLVDSHRTAQAVAQAGGDWVLALGDVNSEVTSSLEFPSPFTALPSGSWPGGYYLGSDLYTAMTAGGGLVNDPFVPFDAIGWEVAYATQQDGTSLATRPTSQRRIDYIFMDPAVAWGWEAEVFDCADDAAGMEGLPKKGAPLDGNECGQASDHLPVIIDLAP